MGLKDRKDGKYIRNLDSLHRITGIIYPNRCDNEAFISDVFDLTKTNEYLEKKNANNPEYKYNIFQICVCAILKTIYIRDYMNRFIVNKTFYQRNEVSASFVVKKEFTDKSTEGLAKIVASGSDNIDTIHEKIRQQVKFNRSSKDKTSENMDFVAKLPNFLFRFIAWCATVLDRYGLMPQSVISTDPYYSSVVISNLGSIKLKSGYHHLTNWGTTSFFVTIGIKEKRPFYDEEGNVTMKDSLDIGTTIDERLADGYYYSKTMRLIKKLIENPELLEKRIDEEVDY